MLVPDNLKAAVVRAAFAVDGETVLNRSYRELARHYGFQIDPAPPASPEKKGKVERCVRYVRTSFLSTYEPVDMDVDRRALARWLEEVASTRRHGTTGRVVLEHFEAEERAELLALPASRFEVVLWKEARVHRDVHVQAEGAFYSVPWTHVGRSVWLRIGRGQVVIHVGDVVVATHPRLLRGQRSTTEDHLPERRGPWRHRSKEHWMGKAKAIGPDTAHLAEDLFAADDVLCQLRKVQAVVTYLEKHPPERANAAARRALHFGCLGYGGVKNILTKALDLEPLDHESPKRDWASGSRFARDPAQMVLTLKEDPNGETD